MVGALYLECQGSTGFEFAEAFSCSLLQPLCLQQHVRIHMYTYIYVCTVCSTLWGVSVAWLMEQVILRLGYGIDEGLSPAKVTLWRIFSLHPPYQQKQKPKKLEERQL